MGCDAEKLWALTIVHLENYIQYPVINHNGKEHEKEYIHKTESICYIAKGNNIVNQLYFNKIIF